MNQCTKNAYTFPWECCFDKSLVKNKKGKKYRGYKSAHLQKSKAERITKKTAAVAGKNLKEIDAPNRWQTVSVWKINIQLCY